jgi:hypothetical protein
MSAVLFVRQSAVVIDREWMVDRVKTCYCDLYMTIQTYRAVNTLRLSYTNQSVNVV